MALPNGDLITTPFDPQMAYPSDRRMQVDTLNSRDSMSMFIRWEGMEVYVLENSKKYILQGGRSNEYWKESGTGTGTGGTTFVGQFPTADLLPTSGRSAGDYAFVGTGDDFVQYNWDNIANQWVMAEGQTDMASEFFHIGYKTPLRRPVIFPLFPKDVLVQESGDFVFAPETAVARFIFVGEVTAIRGIETAAADREIKLVNRTGSDIPLRDKASGIPSDSGFDFGGTDYTWVNGSEITLKGNGTYWELAPNNQVAFSDHLDSVNAQVSVGSDGLEVITGIYDVNTTSDVTLKQIEVAPPILDSTLFFQKGAKFYERDISNGVSVKIFGAKGDGVTDDTAAIQHALTSMEAKGGGEIFFPAGNYIISAQLTNLNRITLRGEGPENTRITSLISNGDHVFYGVRDESVQASFYVSGFSFNGSEDEGYFFHLTRFVNTVIEKCQFRNIGGGAIKVIGTSNVTVDKIYAFNTGRRLEYDYTNAGVIHMDRVDDFNNTLNIINCYISNNQRICGVWVSTHACRIINLTVESCHTLLKLGSEDNTSRSLSVVGLYMESATKIGVHIVNCSGVTFENIYYNDSGADVESSFIVKNSNRISFNTCELGDYGFDIDSNSYSIDFHNCTGVHPELGISGVNTRNVGKDAYYQSGYFGKSNNLVAYSNEFESWTGSASVTEQNNFTEGGKSFLISKSSATSARSRNISRTFQSGDKVCASVYVKGRASIQLRARRSSDNEFETIAQITRPTTGSNPEWFRFFASAEIDKEYNLIVFNIVPGNYSVSSEDAEIAHAQFEVGRLEPGPYVLNIGNTYVEQTTNASINGSFAIKGSLIDYSDGVPISGRWNKGDRVYNNSPSAGGPLGWVCMTTGSPGIWRAFGEIGINESVDRGGSNYTFQESDLDRHVRFTGASGNATVPDGVFLENRELKGEIEGGAKTLVAGTGVTFRFPEGQGLTAPTGSRFIVKFKSPNDALVTIIKPYSTTAPNATTTERGILELATQTETNTGTDNERAVTPLTLQGKFDGFATYGTYVPIINSSGTNPTLTYVTQYGAWRKIGRLMQFEVRIEWNGITGAGTGSIGISLPAGRDISESNNATTGGLSIGLCSGITITNGITATFLGSSTGVRFYDYEGVIMPVSALKDEGILLISGSYRTSS